MSKLGYKEYIYYGDTTEAPVIDSYELEETIEDTSRLFKVYPGDMVEVCPRCLQAKAIYGTTVLKELMWHCQSCGLLFSPELMMVMRDVRELDRMEEGN
jgi:hypothetical protein